MNDSDGNFCPVVTSRSLMLGSLLLRQNSCCSLNFCIVYRYFLSKACSVISFNVEGSVCVTDDGCFFQAN